QHIPEALDVVVAPVAERAVRADAEVGVVAAVALAIHDLVVGIADAQYAPAVAIIGLDLEASRVVTAARDFDDHAAARAGLDRDAAGEVEDGDPVAAEREAFLGAGRRGRDGGGEGEQG